eukprot:scaffold1954_cov268-Pinguiococcus_pyrenoidosus.AAC.106
MAAASSACSSTGCGLRLRSETSCFDRHRASVAMSLPPTSRFLQRVASPSPCLPFFSPRGAILDRCEAMRCS